MFRRLFAGFCLAACLALSIAACGSSSSSPSSGSTTAQSGSAQGQQGAAKPQPSIAAEEAAPGDHSIQDYGTEALGAEKDAVLSAMRSFFNAMANSDYAGICSGLTASNREQLAQFAKLKHEAAKGCAASLSGLLNHAAAGEAKKRASVTIGKVRIKGDTAFVLFRPPAGVLSYFAMKEEGGVWKATSISTGTPLNPTATP